jgi:hypothetical protein
MLAMEARQDGREPAAGRALERADAKHAHRPTAFQLVLGFVRQPEQALRVRQQQLAFGRQHQPAALLAKQRPAQPLFQLLDAGGDVGLHAVQLAGRAQHAAFLHDGAEDVQAVEIDASHGENDAPDLFICGRRPFWM